MNFVSLFIKKAIDTLNRLLNFSLFRNKITIFYLEDIKIIPSMFSNISRFTFKFPITQTKKFLIC